jgi:hypothetical protein
MNKLEAKPCPPADQNGGSAPSILRRLLEMLAGMEEQKSVAHRQSERADETAKNGYRTFVYFVFVFIFQK